MKIAFLLRYWPYYGGGETVTRVLCKEFLQRVHEVHIIYWWDSDQGRQFVPEGNYHIHKIDVEHDGEYEPAGNLEIIKEKAEQYIVLNKIEYVINQWWPAEITPCGESFKNIKCWHTMVCPGENNNDIFRRLYHTLNRGKRRRHQVSKLIDPYYNVSDKLVFLANIYAEEYKMYSSVCDKSDKVAYIHNPLTYESVPQLSLDAKKNEVVFVGRIEEKVKKITRIIDAWSLIQNYGYTDWTLKIIGDGPDLDMLKQYAKERNVNNLVFTGAKDPRADYETAKLLLLTSALEGWPMTIVEGKSYGVVPIVTKTYSAATEVVNDGIDGLVVNSTKPENIANSIKKLIENPDMLIRLSENAQKDAKRYLVNAIVDRWEVMFSSFCHQ